MTCASCHAHHTVGGLSSGATVRLHLYVKVGRRSYSQWPIDADLACRPSESPRFAWTDCRGRTGWLLGAVRLLSCTVAGANR